MNEIFSKTLSELTAAALQLLREQTTAWQQEHAAIIQQGRRLLTTAEQLQPANDEGETDLDLGRIWQALSDENKRLEAWLRNLQLANRDLPAGDLVSRWRQTFARACADLPDSVTISREHDTPEAAQIDDFDLKLRRTAMLLSEKFTGGLGARRQADEADKRTIELKSFFRFFVEEEVAEQCFIARMLTHRRNADILNRLESVPPALSASQLSLQSFELAFREPARVRANMEAEYQKQLDHLQRLSKEIENRAQSDLAEIEQRLQHIEEKARSYWNIAATFQLPARRFGAEKAAARRDELKARELRCEGTWQDYFDALVSDWQGNFSVMALQIAAARSLRQALGDLEHRIDHELIPTFIAARDSIDETAGQLQAGQTAGGAALQSTLIQIKTTLIADLQENRLPSLIDRLHEVRVDEVSRRLEAALSAVVDTLPEKNVIIKKQEIGYLVPEFEVDEVDLKELLNVDLIMPLSRDFKALRRQFQDQSDKILQDIAEVDQIVEYNLDAASDLIAKPSPEDDLVPASRRTAVEGLERASAKLDSLAAQYREGFQNYRQQALNQVGGFEQRLQELIHNERVLEIKIRLARAKARAQVQAYRKELWKQLRYLLPRVWKRATGALDRIRGGLLRLGKATGIESGSSRVSSETSSFLDSTQRKLEQLPYVYQRLFRLEPLMDERFFAGRSAELQRLHKAHDLWKAGEHTPVAIIGEVGSGKTSLLNIAVTQIFAGEQIRRMELSRTIYYEKDLFDFLKALFEIEDCRSLDELENFVQELKTPAVCILEKLQRMFLRIPSGFDAIERFLLFVARTSHKILWVCTWSSYCWQYLDRVINISDAFRFTVDMAGLNQEEMEQIILKRHRVSGFRLHYEGDSKLLNARAFKKLETEEDKQQYLRYEFFKRMHDLAQGNITIALLLWQRAISSFTGGTIHVTTSIDIDFALLDRVSPEKLFILAAIIQHEALNAKQYALVFRQSARSDYVILRQMANSGVLVEKDGFYSIHPFLYRYVIRTLRSKNYLYD